ncbi:carbohydrate ABC transporter permease [Trueperella pyogenes]|uniref:Carbohydrate ABC transporter permease n=1 Tax=Trueperella pyogenes TaxID=1661 RepID=A0ABV3NDF1_9ACTO|nr:carbohydrate ABC transporter permease [Trueperella pyogenes]ALD73380.1 sugar ABC transporter permease [Trueperella pyogenes]AWA43944.1 carbohydrate ABC transporter permease [Trueperella pyogenes]AWG03610.1 carbohydrate ABC transporter permease [Trueperella pyogenes]AWG16341.1 carbohydrate ABC transporter permease [Trueperella pyogenes]AZR01406.1 carbohydrate ABC transporter permease [Trueperella pyogenes]
MTKHERVPRERSVAVWRVVQPVIAVVLAVILIGVPLWTLVVNAGKNQAEAAELSLGLPTSWQLWENLREVWVQADVGWAFIGSLMLLLPSVFLVLVLGSMAAWVLARRGGKMSAALYAIGISGIVLPPAVVTLVLLLRQLGLAGLPIGMIATYVGMYMSTVIFFVTGFVRTIPPSLEEAARIDGAGPVQIFFRLILPLLKPVLSTATILISLYVWNDIFYAFFVIGGRVDTLPLNLYTIASSGIALNNWHLIFAYVLVMSIPLVTIFVVFQKKIISGITSGAVK